MKYRIVFSNEKTGKTKQYDVEAVNSDEAFSKAYSMSESKSREYSDVSVQEIPEGARMVGLHVEVVDRGHHYSCYKVFKAYSDEQAVEYYNKNYLDKKCDHISHELSESGLAVFGRVLDVYLAACPGCDEDLTDDSTVKATSF